MYVHFLIISFYIYHLVICVKVIIYNRFYCYRSMGILLPPVAQVSLATSTPLTLHHRNRSLDSALQRIPEVDVTPSPDGETQVTLVAGPDRPKAQQRPDELASLGSDDSGILCGSDTGSCSDSNATRESSVECLDATPAIATCEPKSETEDEDEDDDDADTRTQVEDVKSEQSAPPKSSGLLRLLESKVFDVSMAMHYLFNSKEPGVLCYIVNKMFSFDDHEVDFYLPQLVSMYIQMQDVAEVIHRYLIHR